MTQSEAVHLLQKFHQHSQNMIRTQHDRYTADYDQTLFTSTKLSMVRFLGFLFRMFRNPYTFPLNKKFRWHPTLHFFHKSCQTSGDISLTFEVCCGSRSISCLDLLQPPLQDTTLIWIMVCHMDLHITYCDDLEINLNIWNTY